MIEVVFVLAGLSFPAVMALLDAIGRPEHHFAGGADDRRGWIRWLVVAVATAWILVGNGIVLGYYYSVVRRNQPGRD